MVNFLRLLTTVSIHAPAWGATVFDLARFSIKEFQSTLPHGERLVSIFRWTKDSKFQSTLPHGERLHIRLSVMTGLVFQSTLPHGERHHWHVYLHYVLQVSIHAPAWGATSFTMLSSFIFRFQSTLPHGERLKAAAGTIVTMLFQSTLPHGERRYRC